MAKKIKDTKRDSIDFGTTKIDTMFHSIGIYSDADVHFPARHVARCSCDRVHDAGRDSVAIYQSITKTIKL